MSSIYHGQLTVSIFGQSHAPAIGVTVDGLPAGEPVDLEELQVFLNRRAPGTGNWSTPRKEGDQPEFLSGLSQGRTCGAPLTAVIRNTNTRSGDYADLRDIPRPGHGIDRTLARNQDLETPDDVTKVQEHNEREKDRYSNVDIVPERTALNVHFKSPTDDYVKMFEHVSELLFLCRNVCCEAAAGAFRRL